MSRCRLVAGAFVCAVAKKHNGIPNHLPPAGLHVPPELKEGVCGNYYLKRAIVNTQLGLGANLPEDAIYPINIADETGKPLDGGSAYVLHFDRGATPPANTFWSVTLYDAQGYQVVNSLNRFAVSSWMPFKYNPDGSLDLYPVRGKALCLPHESPALSDTQIAHASLP